MAGVQLQQPSMTDYRVHQPPPARKPVPGVRSSHSFQSYDGHHHHQLAPHPSAASLAHSRSRTSSSHVLPYVGHQQHQQPYSGGPSPHHTMTTPPNYIPARRLSSATTSTNSTGNATGAAASDIRRSTSSRSANAQLGYVALMRRQKATVWCDRAQPEDPRIRAQKLVDKKRAYLEVHGAGAGRSGTLASNKNKHSTKGTMDFSASTLVGATVPLRLSANEVGDADEESRSDNGFPYRRTGSGRSSVGSAHRYPSGYQRTPQGTMGSNVTPPGEKSDLPGVSEHPPAERREEEKDVASLKDDAATTHSRSSEQEDNFGSVGDMAAPSAVTTAAEKAKKADELRRRGSVDDRTTSMTNVRLFVANPDLSD
ncbi:uncharacterized protein KD926_008424 [Aspergillus affinis]|uniref:uncharacterized protein n=1 Tax=Aspergillus affinis TaxID=1070780 RepID=UPI0022FE4152|nr:uncharacterized protein KD926_008424 [Aspergillus affinis]KAI9040223.1 hypothetical protein KD926_008424 [Aspergillus affinis]